MNFRLTCVFLTAALCLSSCQSKDDAALIAVSTNFRATFEKLETVFEAQTDFSITQVNGATGAIYTQILNGAPYHAFLSADEWRPQELASQGLASGQFVYAKGELVLWSKSDEISTGFLFDILGDSSFKPVAIANPALAPYGAAAQETFGSLNLNMRGRLVIGENVGQAFALIESGNARAGLVAKSDALRYPSGHYVTIDSKHYAPIKQAAVLLEKGEKNEGAKAFLAFLQSPKAQEIIISDGYMLDGFAL